MGRRRGTCFDAVVTGVVASMTETEDVPWHEKKRRARAAKEMRENRFMGIFLLVFAAFIIVLYFIFKHFVGYGTQVVVCHIFTSDEAEASVARTALVKGLSSLKEASEAGVLATWATVAQTHSKAAAEEVK